MEILHRHRAFSQARRRRRRLALQVLIHASMRLFAGDVSGAAGSERGGGDSPTSSTSIMAQYPGAARVERTQTDAGLRHGRALARVLRGARFLQ